MESELQSQPAAETASSGSSESTASAPAAASALTGGGPRSWEAAFSADDDTAAGASNSDTAPASPESSAPAATPAASVKDAAPDAAGAPAEQGQEPPGQQREPQPGSRRSTANELSDLREQVRSVVSDLEAERAAKAEQEAAAARARAEAESAVEELLGKPGEMAALLQKRMQAQRSGNWSDFTQDDEDRLTRLTEGALLYQPLRERAQREAEALMGAAADQRVADAERKADGLYAEYRRQFEAALTLGLPGLPAETLKAAPDIASLIRAAHAAGAASRDGEIAEIQGRLTDAQARAFTSQPRMAAGGVSGNGRTDPGYDPTRSPASNLESAFADDAALAAPPNGRR